MTRGFARVSPLWLALLLSGGAGLCLVWALPACDWNAVNASARDQLHWMQPVMATGFVLGWASVAGAIRLFSWAPWRQEPVPLYVHLERLRWCFIVVPGLSYGAGALALILLGKPLCIVLLAAGMALGAVGYCWWMAARWSSGEEESPPEDRPTGEGGS